MHLTIGGLKLFEKVLFIVMFVRENDFFMEMSGNFKISSKLMAPLHCT